MSNCDNSSIYGTITSTDYSNAIKYASMKLLKEKTDKLNTTNSSVSWEDRFGDKTTSYRCPKGLTCFEGYPRITNKDECLKVGPYSGNDEKKGLNPLQYYLEWRDETKNCYLGNWEFRNTCETTPKDNPHNAKLQWDNDSHTCYLTQDFCKTNGFLDYQSGSGPNGSGGSCQMSVGQDVASLFGQTFARGIVGGACFHH